MVHAVAVPLSHQPAHRISYARVGVVHGHQLIGGVGHDFLGRPGSRPSSVHSLAILF